MQGRVSEAYQGNALARACAFAWQQPRSQAIQPYGLRKTQFEWLSRDGEGTLTKQKNLVVPACQTYQDGRV